MSSRPSLSKTESPLRIRFGIVLLPNLRLTAFSSFVDLLRLVRCSWTVMQRHAIGRAVFCSSTEEAT